jgi:O-antigen/teichoic acid export membrane protein
MNGSGKPMLALICGRSLAFAGTFLIPVVLARVFDQTEFGTYKQFFLLWSSFYALGQFGMAESLFYFLPRAPRKAGPYAANSLLSLTMVGGLCLWLLQAGGTALSAWMGNQDLSAYMGLIGLFLALTMASAMLEIVMVARKQYLRAALTYGLSDLVRAACLILPALLWRRLEWVFVGAVVFAALRLGAALAYLGREFRGGLRPDAAALKAQLAYVVPFGAAVVIDVVQTYFHQYAVSHVFGAAIFAVYSVGCLNIPLVDLVTNPMSNVMMVRMGEAMGEGRGAEVVALWHDTTRKLALLLVPLVAFLLLTGRELIVLLFTEAYLPSVPVFMICSTGILWSALNTDGVLRAYADTRFLLALAAVRLTVNGALLAWFLGAFHLPGAALATILAVATAKLIALARIRRLMGTGWAQLLPWRSLGGIAAAAAAAALPALILKARLGIAPLPLLVGTGLVYAATLAGLFLRFGLLTDNETLTLSGWLRRASQGAGQAVRLART